MQDPLNQLNQKKARRRIGSGLGQEESSLLSKSGGVVVTLNSRFFHHN